MQQITLQEDYIFFKFHTAESTGTGPSFSLRSPLEL